MAEPESADHATVLQVSCGSSHTVALLGEELLNNCTLQKLQWFLSKVLSRVHCCCRLQRGS